jgi:stress response protein SCP2
MGLGWAPADHGRNVDLDASAIVIGARGKKVDSVWFMSQNACSGAIGHSGDNLTGHGGGDDEMISVDLERLPADVQAVVFTVNSFQGQKFTDVRSAYCRLVDIDTETELVRFDITESAPRTGVVMSVLKRNGAVWEMTAIGEFEDGRTVRSMYKVAERIVAGWGRLVVTAPWSSWGRPRRSTPGCSTRCGPRWSAGSWRRAPCTRCRRWPPSSGCPARRSARR